MHIMDALKYVALLPSILTSLERPMDVRLDILITLIYIECCSLFRIQSDILFSRVRYFLWTDCDWH